jgi:hypothetical protein
MPPMPAPRLNSMQVAWLILSAIVWLPSAACERSTPSKKSTRAWPTGTVLALNGEPILADDVDRAGGDFALVEPNDSLTHLRRLALTNVIFPRLATATADPAKRAEARATAERYRAALEAGTLPLGALVAPMEVEKKGGLSALGMEVWHYAQDAEIDRWSPVLETVGAFQVARLKKRITGRTPAMTDFTVGVFDFPYVDAGNPRVAIDAAIDRSRLEFVDESWREVVPTAWIYRMRGETP